jgi:hypothetical protein
MQPATWCGKDFPSLSHLRAVFVTTNPAAVCRDPGPGLSCCIEQQAHELISALPPFSFPLVTGSSCFQTQSRKWGTGQPERRLLRPQRCGLDSCFTHFLRATQVQGPVPSGGKLQCPEVGAGWPLPVPLSFSASPGSRHDPGADRGHKIHCCSMGKKARHTGTFSSLPGCSGD